MVAEELCSLSSRLAIKPIACPGVSFFKRLEPDELERLAAEVDQVDFPAGATIFNERDKGDALYVVETGSVRIWLLDEDAEPVTLAELKPGDFFGELAVLDRGRRSTNATALVDTQLHRLSSDDFQQFLLHHPEASIDVICNVETATDTGDWTKPAAMAIPKEGYFKREQGRYGPIFPRTPPTMASRSLPRSSPAGKRHSRVRQND